MKISLTIEAPTFNASVPIPRPGQPDAMVDWTFKYRDADEFDKFRKNANETKMPDLDYIMEIASGWELDEAFTKKNLTTFFRHYRGAPRAVIETYIRELAGVRVKN